MAFKPLSRANSNFEDEIRVQFEKKGDSVEGYYLGTEKFTANGEEYTKHRIRDTAGDVHSFLGSYILNNDLGNVTAGTMVRVTYKGKEKSAKGRMFKAFDIEVDDENVIQIPQTSLKGAIA